VQFIGMKGPLLPFVTRILIFLAHDAKLFILQLGGDCRKLLEILLQQLHSIWMFVNIKFEPWLLLPA
jgi:hypothetical protein